MSALIPSPTANKPRRNSRTVPNGYVNVDNVPNIPGVGNINYIVNCRSKLYKRELGLTTDKKNRIQNVINENISKVCCHISGRYKIRNNLTDSYLNGSIKILKTWNGITVKSSRDISTFGKYFKASKAAFDQKKKSIKHTFWMPILNSIKEFLVIAAMLYFTENVNDYINVSTSNVEILRKQLEKYLLPKMLLVLLESTVSYKHTRPVPIISCCLIRDDKCMSEWINKYFDLDINLIIQNINENNNESYGAKTLKLNVVKQLNILINKYKAIFEENKNSLLNTPKNNNNNNNNDNNNVLFNNNSNLCLVPQIPNYDDYFRYQGKYFTPNSTTSNGYQSCHVSSNYVSDQRYHPMYM